MKDALDETLILSDKSVALARCSGASLMSTHRIIQDLAAEIVVSIGALYKASEAVAILDMLWSFAHVSIRASLFCRHCCWCCSLRSFVEVRNYGALTLSRIGTHIQLSSETVRPEFTGTLAIKAGRHPILETVQSAGTLVPNDVYCSEAASFQIVQGPKCVLMLTGASLQVRHALAQHVRYIHATGRWCAYALLRAQGRAHTFAKLD